MVSSGFLVFGRFNFRLRSFARKSCSTPAEHMDFRNVWQWNTMDREYSRASWLSQSWSSTRSISRSGLSPNCGAGRTRESFARRGYFFATSLLSEYQAPFQVVTGLPSNEGTARLGVSGAGPSPDGMVIGHGDSPVRQAARRVFLGYTSESIAGFLVPKMKHRHRAGELLAESMERRKPGR